MAHLKHSEYSILNEVCDTGRGAGYVLDFTDTTFSAFFDEEFGIDIDDDRFKTVGISKGKRLRSFLATASDDIAARVFTALWDERAAILSRRGEEERPGLADRYFKVTRRLQGDTGLPSTDSIDRFAANETLEELVAAIQRDVSARKPQVALDRLHTYCMKKFAHLIELHGGSCGRNEPLNSKIGKYINLVESGTPMQAMSRSIMRSSVKIFEDFNHIRNEKSLAHDNELIGLAEATFIFDAVGNVLKFIRAIEAGRFGA